MEAREVKKVKEATGLLESLVSQDEEGVSAKKGESREGRSQRKLRYASKFVCKGMQRSLSLFCLDSLVVT